jgi:hypothetical protein
MSRSFRIDETIVSTEWKRDDYIEKSKFSHLVDRQREKFSLYQSN